MSAREKIPGPKGAFCFLPPKKQRVSQRKMMNCRFKKKENATGKRKPSQQLQLGSWFCSFLCIIVTLLFCLQYYSNHPSGFVFSSDAVVSIDAAVLGSTTSRVDDDIAFLVPLKKRRNPNHSANSERRVVGRVRVYVSLAKNNRTEPFEQNSDDQDTNQVFGVDIDTTSDSFVARIDSFHAPPPRDRDNLKEDTASSCDESGFVHGYPLAQTVDLPRGVGLTAQAEFIEYERYEREGLPATYLPKTCVSAGGSNGAHEKPTGTRYSKPATFTLPTKHNSSGGFTMKLELTEVVEPPAASPGCAGLGDGVDSDWIKTVRITSDRLSKWWGRPIELEACVLIPAGFHDEEHADATYPLVVAHGHYSPRFSPGAGEFEETWPSCDPGVDGYGCVIKQYAYYLYRNWTSYDDKSSPLVGSRMLLATINHPVPFFDDSYAVNSANTGPYGDAINYELIPEIEARFRGIGRGWARGLFGGSTGGWESAASLILYPDHYGYAHASCPDPITFTKYVTVDLTKEKNMYHRSSPFKRTKFAGQRDGYSGTTIGYGIPYGEVSATIEEMNLRELALGTHSRSCGQWDIWEAVFGPACDDGFPCRAYDKRTGEIDRGVVRYWIDNFDLASIVEKNWEALSPRLSGKLHITVGGSDSFYLTNPVYDFEQVVKRAAKNHGSNHPTGGITFEYGAYENGLGFQHCFSGYQYDAADGVTPLPNSITRLTYVQRILPRMAESFVANAPKKADIKSWRY